MVPFGDSHTGRLAPKTCDSRLPTLFELELLDASLVRGYGRALDADGVFLDGFCRIDGDLVVGLVAVLQSLSKLDPSALFKPNRHAKS
jgi:hypothetical protein